MTRSRGLESPILVAGCGSIGRRHLRNLARLGAGQLLACDPDASRADAAAEESGATAFSRLEDVPDPGAVFVCSPTRFHVPIARFGLERGAHLFIEKPISDTLDGVDDLVRTAVSQSRVVMVAFNLRYHPCLQRIRQLITDGEIGRVLGARIQFGQYLPDWHPWEDYRRGYSANKSLGGGIVLDAVHEFDYARWLLGEVRAVAGMMATSGSIDIDTEDLAAFTLRHDGNVISEIHLDYLQRTYSRTCHIIGTGGTISWDWNDHAVRCFRAATGAWEEFREPEGYDDNQTYIDEVIDFFEAVDGLRAPPVDGESGARVLAIALAAKEAATSGRTIQL
jgi:predicted dehydrogenase